MFDGVSTIPGGNRESRRREAVGAGTGPKPCPGRFVTEKEAAPDSVTMHLSRTKLAVKEENGTEGGSLRSTRESVGREKCHDPLPTGRVSNAPPVPVVSNSGVISCRESRVSFLEGRALDERRGRPPSGWWIRHNNSNLGSARHQLTFGDYGDQFGRINKYRLQVRTVPLHNRAFREVYAINYQ